MSNQTYEFQWSRNGEALAGETGATYTLQAADVGTSLTATVTATDSAGSTSATTTGMVIVATAQPDMIVTAIGLPATITAGQQVTFTATVLNQGSAATPAGVVTGVAFSIDGTEVTWSDKYSTSIPVDGSVALTADNGSASVAYWAATSGSHTIEAYVNDINRYPESNTGNNTLSQTIEVAATTGAGGGVQAVMADKFVDFIGAVSTHVTYNGTPYYPGSSISAEVQTLLTDIGIRHIRDGWGTGSGYADTWLQNLHAATGIKMSMIVTSALNETVAQSYAHLEATPGVLPALDYLEGPNEWDANSPGASAIAPWMEQMYSTFHASGAVTASIPILGPSMANAIGTESAYATVGNISQYVDYGNTHDYFGTTECASDTCPDVISAQAEITGSKLLVTTETGWNDLGNGNPTMPRDQIAIDMTRMHFMRWVMGPSGVGTGAGPGGGQWLRSGWYELIDESATNGSGGWGLADVNYNLKPVGLALKAMISLVTDQGATFTPGTLNYTLSGTNSNTQTTLLQKSDGSFWLCIWQVNEPLCSWSGSTGTALATQPARTNITLTLNDGAATSVEQFLPYTSGTTAVASASNVSTTTITTGPEANLVKIVMP